jgi:hypothetical protein
MQFTKLNMDKPGFKEANAYAHRNLQAWTIREPGRGESA